MRRRSLLAWLAATATAGCSSFEDGGRRGPGTFGVGGGTSGPSVARGDALRPVGYAQFEGALAELPGAGVIVAVSPGQTGFRSARGVRFAFESDASETGPATVKATLVNRSDSSAVVDTADVPAFEPRPVYRSNEGGALAFAPTVDHPFALRSPDVRRGDDGTWTVATAGDWLPDELEMDGLSLLTGRYALVGVDDLGPVSTGRYGLGAGDQGTSAYVWDLSSPGPSATSVFQTRPLPGVARFDSWFHDATASTKVWLEPERERVEAPGRVGFELVNHRRETLVGRDDRWQLLRLEDDAWYPLRWRTTNEFSDPLLPGVRVSWTLRVAHGADVPDGDGIAVPYLGGGTYAFASVYEDGFVAAFELVAPTLELEPTPGVRAERDGTVLVVTHPDWTDDDPVFELRESDVTAESRLVTEQVYRDPALRNALAFADDASVVRYRAPALSETGPFRWPSEDATFRYEGETYEMTLLSDADEQH